MQSLIVELWQLLNCSWSCSITVNVEAYMYNVTYSVILSNEQRFKPTSIVGFMVVGNICFMLRG